MVENKKNNMKAKTVESAVSIDENSQPKGAPDYARYEQYLAHSDMNDEAKQKLIEQLWAVAVDFVALAHNQHPVQSVIASFFEDHERETCGQKERPPLGRSPSQPMRDIFSSLANPECVPQKPSSQSSSVRTEEESKDAIY